MLRPTTFRFSKSFRDESFVCAKIGQKLKGSFAGGSSRKGVRASIGVPGEGFRWVVGVVFLWKMRAKGKGVGRVGCGEGTGKGTGKSMRAVVKTTLYQEQISQSQKIARTAPK